MNENLEAAVKDLLDDSIKLRATQFVDMQSMQTINETAMRLAIIHQLDDELADKFVGKLRKINLRMEQTMGHVVHATDVINSDEYAEYFNENPAQKEQLINAFFSIGTNAIFCQRMSTSISKLVIDLNCIMASLKGGYKNAETEE